MTKSEALQYLMSLSVQLDRADRVGSPEDEPEGVRRIWLSDTFARTVSDRLMKCAKVLR